MGRHGRRPDPADEAAAGQLQIAVGAADRHDREAAMTALRAAWNYYRTQPEASAARIHFVEQAANIFTDLGFIDVVAALIEFGVHPVQGDVRRHAISGRYAY